MITLKCQDDTENLKANHKANHARKGTVSIQQHLKMHKKKYAGKIAIICAPGPGLIDNIMSIKNAQEKFGHKVFAIKCGETLEKYGIKVDFNVHVDTKETELKYTYHNKNTTQLISTQCHPKLFDLYKKDKVVRFQSRTAADWHPATTVAQGSNTTLQSMGIAHYLGFSQVVVYGFDLSWDKDKTTHITGDRPMTKDQGQIPITLNNGTEVYTNLVLIGACQEAFAALSLNPIPVHIIGTRLLADYIVEKQKNNGKSVLDDEVHILMANRLNSDFINFLKKTPGMMGSFPKFSIREDLRVVEQTPAAA